MGPSCSLSNSCLDNLRDVQLSKHLLRMQLFAVLTLTQEQPPGQQRHAGLQAAAMQQRRHHVLSEALVVAQELLLGKLGDDDELVGLPLTQCSPWSAAMHAWWEHTTLVRPSYSLRNACSESLDDNELGILCVSLDTACLAARCDKTSSWPTYHVLGEALVLAQELLLGELGDDNELGGQVLRVGHVALLDQASDVAHCQAAALLAVELPQLPLDRVVLAHAHLHSEAGVTAR